MIRPRWKKVFHDLWDNKLRTLLVVASIFIGVFAVGMTVAMYVIIGEDLNLSWFDINPNDAFIYVDPIEPDQLNSVRRLPGVADAEGSRGVSVSLKIGPDKWMPLRLTARPEWGEIRLNLIRPISGKWPMEDHQLVIEKASLKWINAEVGDTLEIKLGDGTVRKIKLVGVVHDAQAGPGSPLGVSGYITYNTLEWLHEERVLTTVLVRVAYRKADRAKIQEISDQVSDHLRRSGKMVYYVYIPPPGEHPAYSQVIGVLGIIGALGFFSLFLAGFLIFNTFSALMVQQVRYIGMMKAIGGRRGQIIGMYLVLILAYSLLALMIAIPLAAYLAAKTAFFLSEQFNYHSLGFRPVPAAMIVQAVVGIGIPLLAGILPVAIGVRIKIAEALSSYGLGKGQLGRGLIDRLVESIRGLSRPMLISIRNTFRRKSRLVLTLITLSLGGAVFIAVFNLRSSMVEFIDEIGRYFLSDVNIGLRQAYPFREIESYVLRIPGVERVEGWSAANGQILDEKGARGESVTIFAPPVNSELIEPVMLAGRWVVPEDQNAIVLNNAFWRAHPDLKVGDEIKLDLYDYETTWRVVGFFKFVGDTELLAYTSYEQLSKTLNTPGRAFMLRIVGVEHSKAGQEKLAKLVETTLKERGFQIGDAQTGSSMGEANAQAINIIVMFFLVFAVLMALVGAIGLMGTMGMNVMERTREIGVMRTLGATNAAVFRIVLVEGMMIGLISWGLGALLSFPISQVLYDILSRALFQTEGKAVITQDGYIIWLVVAVVLSAAASLAPARGAARMTIRDVLAYE